jgi:hypothetical protein
MAPQESRPVLQALHDSRAELHAALEGVSEEQARTHPAPGRWSVLDCVEHLAIVDVRFLSWLQNPQAEPAPPIDTEKEATLTALVAGRATQAQAPEPAQPTGRFATLAEALAQFDAARARSIAFAESQGPGLYSLAVRHPFFGLLNGAELTLLMSAHARRHIAQIREVRAAL